MFCTLLFSVVVWCRRISFLSFWLPRRDRENVVTVPVYVRQPSRTWTNALHESIRNYNTIYIIQSRPNRVHISEFMPLQWSFMSCIASEITSKFVYHFVHANSDKNAALLSFMRGIHRWPSNFPHKKLSIRNTFPWQNNFMRYNLARHIFLLNGKASHGISPPCVYRSKCVSALDVAMAPYFSRVWRHRRQIGTHVPYAPINIGFIRCSVYYSSASDLFASLKHNP